LDASACFPRPQALAATGSPDIPRHPEAFAISRSLASASISFRCRGEPHPLAASPFHGGQPTAIGIPHDPEIANDAPHHESSVRTLQLKIFETKDRLSAKLSSHPFEQHYVFAKRHRVVRVNL
jgi:hypothetical protein